MPAISFQPGFLDSLLSGSKQQTTRPVPPVPPKHPRFKVGDVAHIYNQQRRRIRDKPLRRLTRDGIATMRMDRYPFPSTDPAMHYAHFLGKVLIAEVYEIRPFLIHDRDLEVWAHRDGFSDFATARCWFEVRYGARWMHQYFTVVRWDGWLERYFEPESPCIPSMNERSAPATFDCDHRPRGSKPD